MQDNEIIRMYLDRNEQAIAESDRKYGALCHSVAMNILDSRPDAEECVNDTWLKAWNSIPPQHPTYLKAFLCRITRNLALDRFRTLHRRKRNADIEVSLSELEACIPMPEESADELPGLLNMFLDGLDSLERRLFMGKYWHGYSLRQLAKGYGLSENAVSLHLMRTRKKLKAFLEERGYRL